MIEMFSFKIMALIYTKLCGLRYIGHGWMTSHDLFHYLNYNFFYDLKIQWSKKVKVGVQLVWFFFKFRL